MPKSPFVTLTVIQAFLLIKHRLFSFCLFFQREIQKLRSTMREAANKSDLIRQKLQAHVDKLSQFDAKILKVTDDVNKKTESASQVCDPVSTRR